MRAISLLLGLAVMTAGCDRQKPSAPQAGDAPAAAQQQAKGLDRSHKGTPAPDIEITNPDGGKTRLAAMKGVPTLMNLWATWCAPCVKELPTLDKLAESHVTDGQFGVLAISQDMGPQPSVAAFLDEHGIQHLGAFHDPEMKLTAALGVQIMPTTILYDGAGREVWRYVGELDWTGPEASTLLKEAGPTRPDLVPPASE